MKKTNLTIRNMMNAWSLGLEAASVMTLRTMAIARGGPAAKTEAQLMVSEKLAAAAELQTQALTGGLGTSPERVVARTLAHYRRKVRANRRRLSGK